MIAGLYSVIMVSYLAFTEGRLPLLEDILFVPLLHPVWNNADQFEFAQWYTTIKDRLVAFATPIRSIRFGDLVDFCRSLDGIGIHRSQLFDLIMPAPAKAEINRRLSIMTGNVSYIGNVPHYEAFSPLGVPRSKDRAEWCRQQQMRKSSAKEMADFYAKQDFIAEITKRKTLEEHRNCTFPFCHVCGRQPKFPMMPQPQQPSQPSQPQPETGGEHPEKRRKLEESLTQLDMELKALQDRKQSLMTELSEMT